MNKIVQYFVKNEKKRLTQLNLSHIKYYYLLKPNFAIYHLQPSTIISKLMIQNFR